MRDSTFWLLTNIHYLMIKWMLFYIFHKSIKPDFNDNLLKTIHARKMAPKIFFDILFRNHS
jgi:hypothetical protein